MANPKKLHEQVAANLQAQRDGNTPPAESEGEKNDLDKKDVQQRIMDPNGTTIKLSYGDIVVYPFTMLYKRRASGFLSQVFADAIGGGARSEDELNMRVASLLMRREDLERELFRLSAVACFKPGVIQNDEDVAKKVLPIVVELQQNSDTTDIFKLFSAVCDLAEFKAPKT